jgi:hypothetical protein
MQTMGMRCLGYSSMNTLCIQTLIAQANCQNPEILAVCSLLEAPTVSRVPLVASGIVFGFFLGPLLFLKSRGFFHKLQRPAVHSHVHAPEHVCVDETDMF